MTAPNRLLRAFMTALRMTLRGEKPLASPKTALEQWVKQTLVLSANVLAIADANGLDVQARRQRTLTAEGRRTNMDTILASVTFHAAEEFPHLLTDPALNALGAVYSTNLNDRFLVSKLFDALESGDVREAVGRLASHLESIPPIE
ncbi:MAG: hypothetical protein IPK52_11980 [Chloroflexi bacterium]|nr:hypothetical protein [Chloroflexota bacterium]